MSKPSPASSRFARWCKNVRSDTGYWQTVEQYVRTHSDASFSHGICPDLRRKIQGRHRPQPTPQAAAGSLISAAHWIFQRNESAFLHEFHHGLSARFGELNGAEIVADYGDWLAEHKALRETAGVIDFSFRSRICLTGDDRVRFLHGQVTNDVKKLHAGEGCYAAITTAKGKMESDLNIFNLADELLLDFEPGLTEKISARLEKFIVADDVQIVDVAPHYGLLSVQGPKAAEVVRALDLFPEIPTTAIRFDENFRRHAWRNLSG